MNLNKYYTTVRLALNRLVFWGVCIIFAHQYLKKYVCYFISEPKSWEGVLKKNIHFMGICCQYEMKQEYWDISKLGKLLWQSFGHKQFVVVPSIDLSQRGGAGAQQPIQNLPSACTARARWWRLFFLFQIPNRTLRSKKPNAVSRDH